MMNFFAAVIGILWFLGLVGCAILAVGGFVGEIRVPVAIVAGIAFLTLTAAFIALMTSDDEAAAICARGHQEYRSNGKSTYKVWICDERVDR